MAYLTEAHSSKGLQKIAVIITNVPNILSLVYSKNGIAKPSIKAAGTMSILLRKQFSYNI